MKHEELFYSVLCKLYHIHGFLAIESTLSSMLDILATYTNAATKSRGAGIQDDGLRYVLSNMKRWKDYWNCSNLQVEFSSGKFYFLNVLDLYSQVPNLAHILHSFGLKDEFCDLVLHNSVSYGEEVHGSMDRNSDRYSSKALSYRDRSY